MERQAFTSEQYSRSILDSFHTPVLIVDNGLYIHDANTASKALLGDDIVTGKRQLCGDTIHCLHAIHSTGGCGTSKYCHQCAIRTTAGAVFSGAQSFRQISDKRLEIDGTIKNFCFLVTGSPLRHADNDYVILSLEDITELVELRRLIPICSHCRKVRDIKSDWQSIEDYFHKYTDVRFTHGICPDCVREQYPDIYDG